MGIDSQRQSLSLGGAMSSLTASPSGELLAAAGREVLRIVSVQGTTLVDKRNLRVGKINLNFSTNSVEWHPYESFREYIATAATNGAVVIWNIEKDGPSKQVRVYTEHTRTSNSVAWHPNDPYGLLSGSQDGTIKLWDMRGECRTTFNGKSESVRDVKFSPHNPSIFAAAFENGKIQLWDIRKHSIWERQITAHQGLALTLDWHPDEKYRLASGGRDRTIKIWDLNTLESRPVSQITSIASVSKIAWRPEYRSHIASAAAVTDFDIHVWDTTRPFIPVATLKGHKDVASGLLWHQYSAERLISASKDSTVAMNYMSEAYLPYDHLRTTCLAWDVENNLAVVSDPCPRGSSPNPFRATKRGNSLDKSEGKDSRMPTSYTSTIPLSQLASSNDSLAPGMSRSRSVKSLRSVVESGIVKVYKVPVDFDFSKRRLNNAFVTLARNYRYTGRRVEELCAHNAQVAAEAGVAELEQMWKMLALLYDQGDDLMVEAIDDGHAIGVTDVDTLKSQFADMLADNHDNVFATSPALNNTPETANAIMSPGSFQSDELSSGVHVDRSTDGRLASQVNGSSGPMPGMAFGNQLKMSFDPIYAVPEVHFDIPVEPILEHYCEIGDVQTCVAIMLTLGDTFHLDHIEQYRVREWFFSYIEILRKLMLFDLATDIVQLSTDSAINTLNQNSTISLSCNRCGKALESSNGLKCDKCAKKLNTCSICHEPVRGLYVWCQGCGHGGHLNHMQDWFLQNKSCPTGCNHACNFRGSEALGVM